MAHNSLDPVVADAVPAPAQVVDAPVAEFPVPVAADSAPALDAEKLVVYRVALEFQVLAATLVPPVHRVLRDQLERASLSIVLCVAEGAGRRSRRDKRRFYAMARGSATECAAAIDVLRLRRLASESACGTARSLALRIVQMLTKLNAALA
jgi:four helix bundle protein